MTEWGKVYKTLQALSQLSGVAAANMTRDVTAIWNLTVGSINPDMKIRTYDSNALSESKEAAYQETVKPTGIKKGQWKEHETLMDENGAIYAARDKMGRLPVLVGKDEDAGGGDLGRAGLEEVLGRIRKARNRNNDDHGEENERGEYSKDKL